MQTTPFDSADYLDDEDDIIGFLDAAFESGDVKHIARAFGAVARSRGLAEVTRRTGVTREAIAAALSADGNPTFETLGAVLTALGLRMKVERIAA